VGGCDIGVASSISSALMVVRARNVQTNIGTTATPDERIAGVAREGPNTFFRAHRAGRQGRGLAGLAAEGPAPGSKLNPIAL